MSFQIPKLPQISSFTELFRAPEVQFENMVKSLGIQLPPGPQSVVLQFQKSLETGSPIPKPEEILPKPESILASMPKLPSIESMLGIRTAGAGAGTTTQQQGRTLLEEKEVKAYKARVLL